MAHERKCVVCGKTYKYCKRCAQYAFLPTWMTAYCSESCKNTYLAVNQFEFGHIDAVEAEKIIDSLKVKVSNAELNSSIKKIRKAVKDNKTVKDNSEETSSVVSKKETSEKNM
jgi:hypothetical protein